MAIIATLMRSTVTTSESITTAQWHLNENSTVFGSANETDTFPMLILPMSVVGRHGKQQHSHSSHPEHFSPVLLSSEWRPLSRLVFLTIMSCIGGVGNIFMISSVMVEDQLKKAGEHVNLIHSIYSRLFFKILLLTHFECKLDFPRNIFQHTFSISSDSSSLGIQ